MELKSKMKSFKEILFEESIENTISQEVNKIKESIITQKDELLKENEDLRSEVYELQKIINKKAGKIINLNRQLLLIHYLGFFDIVKFQSKEKEYNLFHYIINRHPQSVKRFLNYKEKPKTDDYRLIFNKEDLDFVSDIFYEVGLPDMVKKVNFDLDKIK
jgi:hypothetical protein